MGPMAFSAGYGDTVKIPWRLDQGKMQCVLLHAEKETITNIVCASHDVKEEKDWLRFTVVDDSRNGQCQVIGP